MCCMSTYSGVGRYKLVSSDGQTDIEAEVGEVEILGWVTG